ncbi:MAG: DNA internalization-related competence protein ComEC/Rec2 [Candidatus Omnitrophota bacterium]
MRSEPLAVVCIFFCLGIWIAAVVHIPLFFIYVSAILLLILALFSLKHSLLWTLFVAAAIFCAGALRLINAQTFPLHHISHLVPDKPQKVCITGKVISCPAVSSTFYHSEKTTFTLQTGNLRINEKWQPVTGLIKVDVYRKGGFTGQQRITAGAVQYGDTLLLQGTLTRPAGLRNPGGFDYRTYLANYNVRGVLQVKEKDACKIISSSKTFLNLIFGLKQRLLDKIYTHLSAQEAAILAAILLGERAELSPESKMMFINTGTIHILAISGLHISLIGIMAILFFRFLRIERRTVYVLTMIFLIAYTFLCGACPSVVRAAIMAGIVFLGILINREYKMYNSLGIAALIILLYNPRYLFDAGFCLSFLSVISIVYFSPKIEGRIFFKDWVAPHPLFIRRAVLYTIKAFSVSLSAWIGILPAVAYYSNTISPIAILANLIVVPYSSFMVIFGMFFLMFSWISPLGAVLGQANEYILQGLIRLTAFFAQAPGGVFHCPRPSCLFCCAYFSAFFLIFNHRKLKISPGKIGIMLLLGLNFFIWKPVFAAASRELTVTFLDVGLGDAIFIKFPGEGTMLIDTGRAGQSNSADNVILPFLWDKGVTRLSALLITHPDNDHIGGASGVLKHLPVDYVFDNGDKKNSERFDAYMEQLSVKKIRRQKLKKGDNISGFPGVELSVLHPPGIFLRDTSSDANNNSLVLKLKYKDVSFLFCADIKKEAARRLILYGAELKSDVIKVPHHGSDEGEAERELFRLAAAPIAVISVGDNGRFKFPAQKTLDALNQLGAKIHATSVDGAVIVSTDGKNISVRDYVKWGGK